MRAAAILRHRPCRRCPGDSPGRRRERPGLVGPGGCRACRAPRGSLETGAAIADIRLKQVMRRCIDYNASGLRCAIARGSAACSRCGARGSRRRLSELTDAAGSGGSRGRLRRHAGAAGPRRRATEPKIEHHRPPDDLRPRLIIGRGARGRYCGSGRSPPKAPFDRLLVVTHSASFGALGQATATSRGVSR